MFVTDISPDTWLILLFNAIGWVVAGFYKFGIKDWQHNKMWKQYEKDHGMNGHGGDRGIRKA